MKFSLILSTIGRDDDLDRFFTALWAQSHQDLEVVVIGPLNDPRTVEYLRKWEGYPVRYVGAARGHSRAINIGLAHATGDVVAFPDDDCWYPETLLKSIRQLLESHPEWGGVSGRCMTDDGLPSNGRWDNEPGLIQRHNVWLRACSVSMFIRRSSARELQFDESLGVGADTPWGGGEDPDFLLRLIDRSTKIHYDPSIIIHHPEWRLVPYTESIRRKAGAYGRGFGRVLRKHQYPFSLVASHLVRPLGGAILSLLTFRIDKAQYHWAVLSGRLVGWLSDPETRTDPAPSKPSLLVKG
jgi:glycosyltransferase involved in cell wall biosynthesis